MNSRGLRWGIAIGAGVLLVVLLILLWAGLSSSPRILADSSLTDLLTELADVYFLHSGVEVDIEFEPSVLLVEEIRGGSGADLFIGVDARIADDLEESGEIDSASRGTLLKNRLVLIELKDREGWEERITAGAGVFERPDLGRLAVGNPERTSVGRFAREALERLPEDAILADSSRGVVDLIVQGEADCGITYRTDARSSPDIRILLVFPEESHHSIEYVGALLKGGRHREKAGAFLEWLSVRERYLAIRTHGFMTPE